MERFNKVKGILGDSVQLVLEVLCVLGHLVTLGKELLLGGGILNQDLNLGGNVLLQVRGSGHSVLRDHVAALVLDLLQLRGGLILPAVDHLEGLVKGGELVAEVAKVVNLLLEPAGHLKLVLDSLDLLINDLLLILGNSDAHALEVVVDGAEERVNAVIAGLENGLPLLQIINGRLEVETLLHLLDLILSLLKLGGNGLVVLGIANPGVLGLSQQLQPVLSLLLGVIPDNFNSLDVTLQELGLVRVVKDLLTLLNKVSDNAPLGLQLDQGLLLPLNQLINVLHAGGGNLSGGGHH